MEADIMLNIAEHSSLTETTVNFALSTFVALKREITLRLAAISLNLCGPVSMETKDI